jgi:hypothetical protein
VKTALLAILVIVANGVFTMAAQAHESRPAYLQITLTDTDDVRALLKVPALGTQRLGLYLNMPEDCVASAEPARFLIDNAFTERSAYACAGGLLGKTIAIDGLASTLTDVLVRVQRPDGITQVARLTPTATTFVVEATPSTWAVATTYLVIGAKHILMGIDHLLFVLALLMLVSNLRVLVWTITAFTAAHSLTLAAATLGVVTVPQAPIEAVIALSIVFVASEIVQVSRGKPSHTSRKPWVVAFAFGLLHGFGFAGALTEVGLPESAIPLALLFFNLGVEVGQIAFVLAVLAIMAVAGHYLRTRQGPVRIAAAYGIGIVAAFWNIERIAAFW